MSDLTFQTPQGDFLLQNAHRYPDVYFPLVNESGIMSSMTPLLARAELPGGELEIAVRLVPAQR